MTMFDDYLYSIQFEIFTIIVYILWLLYILFTFGISNNASKYFNDLHYYVKVYISLFLIYRFLPFRKVQFNKFDQLIAFNAGIFLLATTTIDTILKSYAETTLQTII